MDIKFSKIDELKDLIFNTLVGALEKLVLIPEIKYEDKPISNIEKVTVIDKNIDYKKEQILPKFEELSFDFNVACEEVLYDEKK